MPPFFRGRPTWLVAVAVGLAALLASVFSEPAPVPISGRANAVDGDTLRLAGRRVRLVGIDAPELEQSCTDPGGAPWDCGKAARSLMAGLVHGGDVTCLPQGHDRYGRTLARCTAGGADIGKRVIAAGLAVADGDYFADEAAAHAGKLGIWAGPFVQPAMWRREHNGDGGGQDLISAIRNWFR
ncbi:MAG: thermonuclease family protein [Devosia sp.]|nr:thermonuclease family protein [Devosia sp.]